MNLLVKVGNALSLLAAFILLVACGSASKQATAPVPLGATSGLNTFIFVYTDN